MFGVCWLAAFGCGFGVLCGGFFCWGFCDVLCRGLGCWGFGCWGLGGFLCEWFCGAFLGEAFTGFFAAVFGGVGFAAGLDVGAALAGAGLAAATAFAGGSGFLGFAASGVAAGSGSGFGVGGSSLIGLGVGRFAVGGSPAASAFWRRAWRTTRNISSSGAGLPVKISNWRAPCWTNISTPVMMAMPAWRAMRMSGVSSGL